MSVRLQLENGKVKSYCTWYPQGGGDYDITTYHTKCGLSWKGIPIESHECEHLDCAIEAAEYRANDSRSVVHILPFAILFTFLFLYLIGPNDVIDFLMFMGAMYLLFWIWAVFSTYIGDIKVRELNEFRDHGTVNGISTVQI